MRPSISLARSLAWAPRRGYHERVLDYFEKARNSGSLPKAAPNVGTGVVGAPACGDVIQMQIEVDDNDVITKAVFKTYGCASALASSSYATELVVGKTLDQALEIKNSDIAKYLHLPPVKMHCSMLAEDAIRAATFNLKQKRDQSASASAPAAASPSPSAAAGIPVHPPH
jgi:Fe-S cluster assembly scaffold IscU